MKTINRKKMLYRTEVDYTTDQGDQLNDYAMNHALGCPHGCKYPCYAYQMAKRFGQVESYEDWCDPKPVEDALNLLHRELERKKDIRRVHLCFTTDPFPYATDLEEGEEEHPIGRIKDVSLNAIAMFNARGIPVTVLTKGTLPSYAAEGEEGYCGEGEQFWFTWSEGLSVESFSPHPDNYYGISLVSLNEKFRAEWEPNTAPYAERIASLKALHDAGFKTWVSMEPFPALSWEYEQVHYGAHAGRVWHDLGYDDVFAFPKLSTQSYGLKPETIPAWEFIGRFGNLVLCLEAVSFVDRIVFGRWNYNKQMPTDVDDVDAWYRCAAKIVREFCAERGIECVVKNGEK